MMTFRGMLLLTLLGLSALSMSDASRCYGKYRMYLGRLVVCSPPVAQLVPMGQRLPLLMIIPHAAQELGLTEFNIAAGRAGQPVLDLLANTELTLFGPTNEAFEAFFAQQEDSDLPDLVKAHVVPGTVTSDMMADDQLWYTSAGSVIRVNVYDSNRFITANCARMLTADKLALNGIIHVIEKVIPPVTETITGVINNEDSLSTLSQIMANTRVNDTLNDEAGPFTVFAPTNDAFLALGEEAAQALVNSADCGLNLLQNHVISRTLCSAAVIDNGVESATNLLGYDMTFTFEEGNIAVNGVPVVVKDIVGTNGIVHVIDTVFKPDEARNAYDMAQLNGANTALESFSAAGISLAVRGDDDITVFVPTDAAFEAMPEHISKRFSEDAEFAQNVLNFHIVPKELTVSQVNDGMRLPTYNSYRNISIFDFQTTPNKEDIVKTAQCAPVSQTDIQGCNGIVHFIDKVMIPPVGNIMAQLDADSRFSTLAMLIRQAGIDTIFSQGEGHFTLFAPVNEAFDNLDKYTYNCLFQYPEMLKNVLMYHVTGGSLCCAGVYPSEYNPTVSTLTGSLVSICKMDDKVVVGGSYVTECDITATNGVVHRVDRVLPGALEKYVQLYVASPYLMGLYRIGY